jgi:hypothetical protein
MILKMMKKIKKYDKLSIIFKERKKKQMKEITIGFFRK